MPTLEFPPFDQLLTAEQFSQLQQLLQQFAQDVGAFVLTEEQLPVPITSIPVILGTVDWSMERFVLVAAEPFSALLCGKLEPATAVEPALDRPLLYCTSLTFDPEPIAAFLDHLSGAATADSVSGSNSIDAALAAVPSSPDLTQTLKQARSVLRLNNAQIQSQFTLRLIGVLAGSLSPLISTPTAATLQQQVEQERLLNQVTTQIRQSLELPVILQIAVDQVRQVLRVDRLVIYCFDLEQLKTAEFQTVAQSLSELGESESPSRATHTDRMGAVIYEARASEATPSVLNASEAHCFVNSSSSDLHGKNLALAVTDVEIKYTVAPCLLRFLRQAQVRAKLVAPIWIRDRLWGLLIAHQCTQPRQWQENEQRFLQQIAEHLGIAISQAQLYAELQQQKHTLEQRVASRTQELQDVMQAAQSANRAKSEFLASVSHELRTPLTCIIGMSATLQRWTKESLNDRQLNFLQMIHDSGEYLLTLINDILDLSQVEAGKMLLTVSEFSLSRLSQQALKAFEGQAALSEITLELDSQVTPQSDRFIADPRRVQQILFNLLDNAIKFTPIGGKVTLRVVVEENLVVFQVKDRGIGIPESQLPLLFEKFRQLNAGYQRQYRGTGLGLALTKQLVEMHGGWIDVESTVNVGSVFTVRLPRHAIQERDQTPKSRSLSIPNRIRGRIVLIDHQEESANLICDILTAAGYQIIWMIEGASAIDQLEVLQPILVMTDIHLPDIDGYTLIRRLRQNPATKQLKVIALTPPLSEQELDRWRIAGADDYLEQPIRPDRLLQTILALTDQ